MVGGLDELRTQLTSTRIYTEKPARLRRLFCVAFAIGLLSGCDQKSEQPAPPDIGTPRLGIVDSMLSMDEAIRRFRADLPVVQKLEGGSASRDELIAAFVRAVEQNDTAVVRRLHISRAEYAYLYFPSSTYMNAPYRQPPAVAWFLNTENSDKGISRVMRRLGGHDLEWRGYSCAREGREGENAFSRSCTLDYFDPREGTRVTRQLFGSILERDGQHKFLSYANDF